MRMFLAILLAVISGGAYAQTDASVRFQAVDLYVDTTNSPLAAYQLEFSGGNGIQIVGIEGGEHPAFAAPPFYDPRAMQHERAILAAFSTRPAADLPRGETRVATIHLQITGVASPAYQLKLQTAAGPDGHRIAAGARLAERKSK